MVYQYNQWPHSDYAIYIAWNVSCMPSYCLSRLGKLLIVQMLSGVCYMKKLNLNKIFIIKAPLLF